jgi:hypothetical protein
MRALKNKYKSWKKLKNNVKKFLLTRFFVFSRPAVPTLLPLCLYTDRAPQNKILQRSHSLLFCAFRAPEEERHGAGARMAAHGGADAVYLHGSRKLREVLLHKVGQGSGVGRTVGI